MEFAHDTHSTAHNKAPRLCTSLAIAAMARICFPIASTTTLLHTRICKTLMTLCEQV